MFVYVSAHKTAMASADDDEEGWNALAKAVSSQNLTVNGRAINGNDFNGNDFSLNTNHTTHHTWVSQIPPIPLVHQQHLTQVQTLPTVHLAGRAAIAAAAPQKSVAAPKKSNGAPKKSNGGGDLKYREEELVSLLDLWEEILPIGKSMHDRLMAKYNDIYPERARTAASLRNQFHSLCKQKPPTGDPDCPPLVKRAKQIKKLITSRAQIDVLDDPEALARHQIPAVGGREEDLVRGEVRPWKKRSPKNQTASMDIKDAIMEQNRCSLEREAKREEREAKREEREAKRERMREEREEKRERMREEREAKREAAQLRMMMMFAAAMSGKNIAMPGVASPQVATAQVAAAPVARRRWFAEPEYDSDETTLSKKEQPSDDDVAYG